MPRLMLLRHAKAVPQNTMTDEERPLAERGRADMPAVARFMAEQSLNAGLVLVSPARRARETWELLIAGRKQPPGHRIEPRLYAAAAEKILYLVRETPDPVKTLLLVGHNPGLEDLARALAGSGETDALIRFGGTMPTASLAVIDLAGAWAEIEPRRGRLKFFVTPKSLRAEPD
jgi:phosphohistidine phosphatase